MLKQMFKTDVKTYAKTCLKQMLKQMLKTDAKNSCLKQMLKQMLKTDAKNGCLKQMLKTDVKKTNVSKEIMLVKGSSVPSFSIRCLALTTCYPLLILIFLRGLFTSGIFTS
jgi:ribosomal protein S20